MAQPASSSRGWGERIQWVFRETLGQNPFLGHSGRKTCCLSKLGLVVRENFEDLPMTLHNLMNDIMNIYVFRFVICNIG